MASSNLRHTALRQWTDTYRFTSLTMKKSITFLMPGSGKKPAGGYKVVYEYANRLVYNGFNVNIVYTSSIFFSQQTFKEKCKTILRILYYTLFGISCRNWFNLDPRIKEKHVRSLEEKNIPESDFYVATAVETAFYLNLYKKIPLNNKLYLIQDYENWNRSDQFVIETYKYGFKNIVISKWLKRILEANNCTCTLIRNGFDFEYFKLNKCIETRDPHTISMLYHKDERKGCKYGIKALEELKLKYPQLRALLFGVPSRPKNLPHWIEYYQQPDRDTHNKIYNESSIYLAPSTTEGWGLTVGEAMICGNCIVCTDADGFKEMVTDQKTGFICPIMDSKALSDTIDNLIVNCELRIKTALRGVAHINKYSWEHSFSLFNKLLTTDETTS